MQGLFHEQKHSTEICVVAGSQWKRLLSEMCILMVSVLSVSSCENSS